MRVLMIAGLVCVTASPAAAQAFANASRSVAKYSAAESTPGKSCESLSSFKGEGIVSITARVVPATADTPQHCRVVGTITPEVAFEVSLPDKWNQRFYMRTPFVYAWPDGIPRSAHTFGRSAFFTPRRSIRWLPVIFTIGTWYLSAT